MRQNRVKKTMRDGKLAIGAYVALSDPQIVEIIGLAGFDAAFIDMEHTGFDFHLIGEMIRAADLAGVTSIVRLPDNDPKLILRILDLGGEGIVIPHVDSIEEAKKAVEAVRYPPIGKRGSSRGTRAARFGTLNWDEHVRQSNEEVLLSVMIEDEKGIRDIENIAALDGVDIVGIGPTDLAEALGIHGLADPRLRAKVKEIAQRIKQISKAKLSFPMDHPVLPLTPQELLELDVSYCNVSPSPTAILLQTWRNSVQRIHLATGRTL